jgi:hypothetical protein
MFYVVSGLWPLLHRRSFEAVFGPKRDYWLVATVAGLMCGNGAALLATPVSRDAGRLAGLLGAGTAGTLAAVDLVNVPRGRISALYLLDAAVELGWLAAWRRVAAGGDRPGRR